MLCQGLAKFDAERRPVYEPGLVVAGIFSAWHVRDRHPSGAVGLRDTCISSDPPHSAASRYKGRVSACIVYLLSCRDK